MSLAEEFGVHKHCEFTIRTTGHPDRTIVQLRGELDLATRDELYAALMAALRAARRRSCLTSADWTSWTPLGSS